MSNIESVGIIGASGDFGGRVTVQACHNFDEVCTFDLRPTAPLPSSGIDPALSPEESTLARKLPSMEAILDECTTIHWCAPLRSLRDIRELPIDTLLTLHDSVMQNSLIAAQRLHDQARVYGKIAIAHCLMNPERRVLVASDLNNAMEVTNHFKQLGLEPTEMSIVDHDYTMAHSQAPLALLVEALLPMLHQYAAEGLLTTSARELMHALDHRASRLTESTKHSVLSNPALRELIESLKCLLAEEGLESAYF